MALARCRSWLRTTTCDDIFECGIILINPTLLHLWLNTIFIGNKIFKVGEISVLRKHIKYTLNNILFASVYFFQKLICRIFDKLPKYEKAKEKHIIFYLTTLTPLNRKYIRIFLNNYIYIWGKKSRKKQPTLN